MLNKMIHLLYSMLLLVTMFASTQAFAEAEFCWKSSYGRGVGTIPKSCDTDHPDKHVGMCYKRCPPNYEGAVTMCLQNCPSGYINTGFFCHIDKALIVSAKIDICNGSTSCPSGYTNLGLLCGLTTPSVPNGYTGTGLDLIRDRTDRGSGIAPEGCDDGKENSAGLCYPKCKTNYSGAGPVCWKMQCPSGWTDCGLSCAKDKGTCIKVIADQVQSVASLAGNILTAGATSKLQGAARAERLDNYYKTASSVANKLKKLKEKAIQTKETAETIKDINDKYELAMDIVDTLNDPNKRTVADIVRLDANILALADPTGVMGVIAAFTYDTCDKVNTD